MTAETASADASTDANQTAPTTHQGLLAWVEETAALTQPDRVYWVNGSAEENAQLSDELVSAGTFKRLNPELFPNSFAAFSDPADVARVEEQTFICSKERRDAGFTNNWMDPAEMKSVMTELYRGCMRGRTMYVIPFCMGPVEAENPMFGVELTDSEYVVVSMRVMARMGTHVLERMTELSSVLSELSARVVQSEGDMDRTLELALQMLLMRRVVARAGEGLAVLPRGRALISYYANSIAHLLGEFAESVRARDALPAASSRHCCPMRRSISSLVASHQRGR